MKIFILCIAGLALTTGCDQTKDDSSRSQCAASSHYPPETIDHTNIGPDSGKAEFVIQEENGAHLYGAPPEPSVSTPWKAVRLDNKDLLLRKGGTLTALDKNRALVWGGCEPKDWDDQSKCSYLTGAGYVLDLATGKTTPTSKIGAPSPRAFHYTYWDAGRLWMFGGCEKLKQSSSCTAYANDTYSFDTKSLSWQTLTNPDSKNDLENRPKEFITKHGEFNYEWPEYAQTISAYKAGDILSVKAVKETFLPAIPAGMKIQSYRVVNVKTLQLENDSYRINLLRISRLLVSSQDSGDRVPVGSEIVEQRLENEKGGDFHLVIYDKATKILELTKLPSVNDRDSGGLSYSSTRRDSRLFLVDDAVVAVLAQNYEILKLDLKQKPLQFKHIGRLVIDDREQLFVANSKLYQLAESVKATDIVIKNNSQMENTLNNHWEDLHNDTNVGNDVDNYVDDNDNSSNSADSNCMSPSKKVAKQQNFPKTLALESAEEPGTPPIAKLTGLRLLVFDPFEEPQTKPADPLLDRVE